MKRKEIIDYPSRFARVRCSKIPQIENLQTSGILNSYSVKSLFSITMQKPAVPKRVNSQKKAKMLLLMTFKRSLERNLSGKQQHFLTLKALNFE